MGKQAKKHARSTEQYSTNPAWFVAAVIAVIVIAAGVFGLIMFNDAKQIKQHEEQAVNSIMSIKSTGKKDISIEKMESSLSKAKAHTQEAYRLSHSTLWSMASHFPVIGTDISTAQGMTSTVNAIVSDTAPQFLQTFSQLHSAKLSTGDRQINLEPIMKAQKSIIQANQQLQTQVKAYNNLPEGNTQQVKSAYLLGRTKLNELSEKVQQLSDAFQLLPNFLGSSTNTTYAILAMTTSEARSSGGLIGSVGTMSTHNGTISIGDFRENADFLPYGAGSPTSSETELFTNWGPLQMSLDLRDLAVYPDTSRTAEQMREIWQHTPWGNGNDLNGVILMDPVLLQQLIAVNGNVTLPDGRVLTGENTAEFLLNTVYKDIPISEQNAYFSEIAKQAISGMFSKLDFSKLSQVTEIVKQMAENRHFSMYAFDPEVERVIDNAGFTAHAPNSEEHPSFGVYVSEQNASKMDWYIHRSSVVKQTGCNVTGVQTYHVEYTMHNTLPPEQVSSLPPYIVGVQQASQPQGYGVEKTLIFPPKGGKISQLNTAGDVTEPKQTTLNGTGIFASVARIAPGETVTYSFDVTTSDKAVTTLKVDQTPLGWVDPNIKVSQSECKAK